jgi:hypothetical protein
MVEVQSSDSKRRSIWFSLRRALILMRPALFLLRWALILLRPAWILLAGRSARG